MKAKLIRKKKQVKLSDDLLFDMSDWDVDRPWETTPFMLQQRERARNQSSFNYGYNHQTGKVERIMPE